MMTFQNLSGVGMEQFRAGDTETNKDFWEKYEDELEIFILVVSNKKKKKKNRLSNA